KQRPGHARPGTGADAGAPLIGSWRKSRRYFVGSNRPDDPEFAAGQRSDGTPSIAAATFAVPVYFRYQPVAGKSNGAFATQERRLDQCLCLGNRRATREPV